MSFDVALIASSNTPPAVEFRAAAREVVAAAGGKLSDDGVVVALPSGAVLELYLHDDGGGGGMVALRQITPETCTVLFQLAETTSTFIMTMSGDVPPFRTPSNHGAPPDGLPSQTPIATADQLCAEL